MADLVDYIEDQEMARMVGVWLFRIVEDDEMGEDICDAASVALDRVDELLKLIELGG